MSLLTPIALAGGLLAIPIILLYMLRLRRREVVISSTFLWAQVLQDREANTPWQKLRRNLLLFLQLLILALLILALARPFLIVPTVTRGQIELLLDASASMNALDMPNGASRFAAAQSEALALLDTLSGDDSMTVIRVADKPDVLISASRDPLALRAAILAAQPSEAEADWVAALTLAAADAVNADDFDLLVVSDGGLGDAAGLPGVPGRVRYIPIGTSDQNLAISALATRALAGQAPQLFAQITNYGGQDADVIFTLRVDGDLFTAKRYSIPAGSHLPLVSEALPEGFHSVQASLTRPADSVVPDYLAGDDVAWAVASGGQTRRVLLMAAAPNLFLEQVLRSLPGVQLFVGDVTRTMPTTAYDLYIFDGWLPPRLPDNDLFIINPPNSTPLFTLVSTSQSTLSPHARADDPRLLYADFSELQVREFQTVANVGWGDALVTVDGGALLLAGESDGRQVALMPFDLHDSDLPLHITWPILVANLLDWFAPSALMSDTDSVAVGGSLTLRPPLDATRLKITLPDGTAEALPIDRALLAFADTHQPGLYQIEAWRDDALLQAAPFAVNTFSTGESAIQPRPSLQLNNTTINPAQRSETGQREVWGLVAACALAVLMIEWLAYQRRQAGTRTLFSGWMRGKARIA